MAKKPVVTFTGIEEQPSLGDNGPVAIKENLETLATMFDPDAFHKDGTPGGIQVGNIAHDSIGNTGGPEDAGKIVQFKEDGSLPGNIDTANNAVNVTTNINGHAITNIFESDGVTVKKATLAVNVENAIMTQIEVRTDDPEDPEIGRIWLRSDL